MNNTGKLVAIAGLLTIAVWPERAGASTLSGPACTPDSFTNYMSLGGGGCNAGALQLFNFDLYTIDASGTLHAASSTLLDGVGVLPVWNSTTGSLQLTVGAFGLYTGFTPYSVDASHTGGFQIRFTVDPPPILAGEGMAIDPPFGTVNGTQLYCSDELFVSTSGLCASGASPGLAAFSIGSPVYVGFGSPLFELDTRTSIIMNPGLTTASGFDGVVYGFDTTLGTPEPGTLLLLGAGLLALLIRRGMAAAAD